LSNHEIPMISDNIFYFSSISELAENIKQNRIKFSMAVSADYRVNFSIDAAAIKLREIM